MFLVTGLQARTLIEKAQSFSIRELMIATAITTAMVIAARFVWMFPATYMPRWVPSVRKRIRSSWQWPFFLAFTGVRGVVSLAAALAIPLATVAGEAFPQRDLILFITFGVIIITLVGQGLMLPNLVRWLGLERDASAEQRRERTAELTARALAMDAGLARLETIAGSSNCPGRCSSCCARATSNGCANCRRTSTMGASSRT